MADTSQAAWHRHLAEALLQSSRIISKGGNHLGADRRVGPGTTRRKPTAGKRTNWANDRRNGGRLTDRISDLPQQPCARMNRLVAGQHLAPSTPLRHLAAAEHHHLV